MDGRVAVVTGAGRGLGAAIAEELATRGATVVVADVDRELATATAEQIASTGEPLRRASSATCDVSDPAAVAALFDAVVGEHGRIDVLVNNAGLGAVAPSEELSLEVWSQTLAVNLTGTFLCAQAAARHMLQAGRGVIVNVGSVFAATGMPMRAAYAASKHGVVGLTKVLGTEWATRGIRVVAVDPAYVRTALDDADSARAATPPRTSNAAPRWAATPNQPRSPESSPSSPPTTPPSSPAARSQSTEDGWRTGGGRRREPGA
jgi:D-threitol dehydrogenase (NAD+)